MFVNLPVRDLNASMDFFKAIGFTFEPKFTDETAASMIVSEENYVMLLTLPKFREFVRKDISDTGKTVAVITALSAENREAVDAMADKAMQAGATETLPTQDHGFMYTRSFQDLDGHHWEVFYMDMSQVTW